MSAVMPMRSTRLSIDRFDRHRVLKNGSYLVLRLDLAEGPVVCKIASDGNDKLRREIDRLTALRSLYPRLASWLPQLLGEGVIEGGLLDGRLFYLQQFIPGTTLSSRLRDAAPSGIDAASLARGIVGGILDHVDEHAFEECASGWHASFLAKALQRLNDLPPIDQLLKRKRLFVNDRPLRTLDVCLQEILASSAFARLEASSGTISAFGHWNFHAENVILNEAAPDGFHVIDPDASIEVCDPVFGLARLLYSFPHDVAERGGYVIRGDLLIPGGNGDRFEIVYTWPAATMDGYAPLYRGSLDGGVPAVWRLHERLAEPDMAFRLNVCLLLCLLRGVAVNYVGKFRTPDDDLRHFQNNAVFLFLNALELANEMAGRGHEQA